MEWYWIGTLILVLLIALLVTGLPVAISLGVLSAVFLIGAQGLDLAGISIAEQMFNFYSYYPLLALPLFILMGELLFAGGSARDIFDLSSAWLRRIPGGLAVVTIATSAIFATLSGSTVGAVATVGVVTIPEMLRRGYNRRLALGAVGASGCLAQLIPPSILLVLYASILEISIGKTLMAGLVPGVILAAGYSAVAVIWALVDPKAAPKEPPVSWVQRLRYLRRSVGLLIVVAAVTGTIFFGIATATEAAALGALAAFLVGAASGRLTLATTWRALLSAIRTSTFIMLIAAGGKVLSWVLAFHQIPFKLVELVGDLELNRWLILIAVQVIYLLLGAVIDPTGIIIITMPVVGPLLTAFDFNPIWFGVLLMLNLEIAQITPPLGIVVYLIKGIAPPDVKLGDVLKGCFVFLIADVVVMALVIIFPGIALWLPGVMFGK